MKFGIFLFGYTAFGIIPSLAQNLRVQDNNIFTQPNLISSIIRYEINGKIYIVQLKNPIDQTQIFLQPPLPPSPPPVQQQPPIQVPPPVPTVQLPPPPPVQQQPPIQVPPPVPVPVQQQPPIQVPPPVPTVQLPPSLQGLPINQPQPVPQSINQQPINQQVQPQPNQPIDKIQQLVNSALEQANKQQP